MPEDKKFYELFEDKTISNIYKDIYNNATKTRNQLNGLITQLKPYVKSLESAIIIVPLIREYMEILVRNDEHLIKLADSGIRLIKEGKIGSDADGGFLSEKDKKQILGDVDEYNKYKKVENENRKSIDERVDAIKEELLGETIEEEVEIEE